MMYSEHEHTRFSFRFAFFVVEFFFLCLTLFLLPSLSFVISAPSFFLLHTKQTHVYKESSMQSLFAVFPLKIQQKDRALKVFQKIGNSMWIESILLGAFV